MGTEFTSRISSRWPQSSFGGLDAHEAFTDGPMDTVMAQDSSCQWRSTPRTALPLFPCPQWGASYATRDGRPARRRNGAEPLRSPGFWTEDRKWMQDCPGNCRATFLLQHSQVTLDLIGCELLWPTLQAFRADDNLVRNYRSPPTRGRPAGTHRGWSGSARDGSPFPYQVLDSLVAGGPWRSTSCRTRPQPPGAGCLPDTPPQPRQDTYMFDKRSKRRCRRRAFGVSHRPTRRPGLEYSR